MYIFYFREPKNSKTKIFLITRRVKYIKWSFRWQQTKIKLALSRLFKPKACEGIRLVCLMQKIRRSDSDAEIKSKKARRRTN